MTSTVSQALTYSVHAREMDLEVGSIRAATLSKLREFCGMLAEHLPQEHLVEELRPADFRTLIVNASKRWGPLRLRPLRQFLKGWLEWLEEEAMIERRPRLGKLPTPPVRITPKQTFSPAEYRMVWDRGDRLARIIMGLGLFAGCNCSDIEHFGPDSIDGQDLRLAELSALDFADLPKEEDEQIQALEMLARPIESPQVTALEAGAWPKRIVDELLATVAELNGFASGH